MAHINLKDLGPTLKKLTTDKLDKGLAEAKILWSISAAEYTKNEIVRMIQSGVSPVEGQGRFVRYSKSYSDKIKKGYYQDKKIRPVNLTLTGTMLRSIKSRTIQDGFSIWFTDPKAKYHNELGAGKSKVIRRMLPLDGETFSRSITRQIVDIYAKFIRERLKD